MSRVPPYGGSTPPPPPASQPAESNRPGTRGIWIGIALMALAVIIPAVIIFAVWKPFMTADAVFTADGDAHTVALPADERRGLFLQDGTSATCDATDADGESVTFLGMGATSYYIGNWSAHHRFDTGAGDVTFTCESGVEGTEVRIGPVPGIGGMIASVFGSCGLGLALGITGLVLLIVTLVKRNKK